MTAGVGVMLGAEVGSKAVGVTACVGVRAVGVVSGSCAIDVATVSLVAAILVT